MTHTSSDHGVGDRMPPPPPPPMAVPGRPPAEKAPPPVTSPGTAPAIGPSPPAAKDRWREPPVEITPAPRPWESKAARKRRERAEAKKEKREQRRDPAAMVPPWLVSLICHLVILLVLALLAVPSGAGKRLVLMLGESGEETHGPDLVTMSSADTELAIEQESEMPVDVEVPLERLTLDPQATSEASDLVAPEISLAGGAPGGLLSGRTGTLKEVLLAKFGGNATTEDAVKLGLEWLKKNQRSDGSWSLRGPYQDGGFSENQPAATAMAMMAFQGAGHTHLSGEYQDVMERAKDWMVKQQSRDGFFARRSASDHHQLYAQAQCSIAICELYGMTGDSRLRPVAQRAMNFAAFAQSDLGGWRYYFPKGGSDLSVTGWYVMALISGVNAGLSVPDDVLPEVEYFLDSVQSPSGAGYAYQPGRDFTFAMTAEGLLCRQYLGWKRDHPGMRAGIEALLDQKPFAFVDPTEEEERYQRNFYYWYYATQVLHHYGGEAWERWNSRMRIELPAGQVKAGPEKGSWSPAGDQWGDTGGRLYTTCLGIFCLEVYYRHMPLYAGSKRGSNMWTEPEVESR